MYKVPDLLGSRHVVRFAFAGMTAALLAGCADSGRVGGTFGDPLGNPFKSASSGSAPVANIDRDMAAPSYAPRAAIASTPLAAPSGMPTRRVASYEAPAHASPRIAQNYVAPRTERTASIAAPSGHGTWSAEGGMTVIAATGENANILGQRYNIPTDALLKANGLTSSAQVHAGTRVVIPVYNANGSSHVAQADPAPKAIHDHSSRQRLLAHHETAHHETAKHETAKLETHRAEPRQMEPRDVEARNTAKHDERGHWVKGPAPAKVGRTEIKQVAVKQAEMKTSDRSTKVAKADKPAKVETVAEAPVKMKPSRVAKVEEPKKAAVDPTPTASLPPTTTEKVASADNTPEFRWPAHGRIIQGFKAGGNDGINIAVPEGTSVKAAESGVVAYAGSEIKGFGNLVLIRHPNGYVSAYANNGDISVKRGEQVKRGQTIAKSGQSGNVASPQLHFELRKGSTPVDPTRYLAGL